MAARIHQGRRPELKGGGLVEDAVEWYDQQASGLDYHRQQRYNMHMTIKDIETEALKLVPRERARLAEKLLASLEDLSEAEHEQVWAEEAERRDKELDSNPSEGTPADEVFHDARSKLR